MSTKTTKDTTDETAVAKPGNGFAGLGDMSTDDLLGSVETETRGSATPEEARELMGNKNPRLERIDVKHQGACVFVTPEGETIAGRDGFVGVIVGATFHNSYFGKSYDDYEEGDRPPCFSHDGTNVAEGAEEPQSEKGCAFCPRNRDARDKAAREAAFDLNPKAGEVCGNYLSLAVLRPGQDVPCILRVSNQSFKGWAEYVQRLLSRFRARPYEVATHFKLKVHGPNKVSVLVLDVAKGKDGVQGLLPQALRDNLKVQFVNYTALLRRLSSSDSPDSQPSGDARAAAAAAKKAAEAAKQGGAEAGL